MSAGTAADSGQKDEDLFVCQHSTVRVSRSLFFDFIFSNVSVTGRCVSHYRNVLSQHTGWGRDVARKKVCFCHRNRRQETI